VIKIAGRINSKIVFKREGSVTEIRRIEDQLKRSLEGEAWHGPALRELLAGVTAKQAAAKPLAGAHSIWEIVLHIIGSEGLVCERLEGKPTVLSPDEDWPPVTETSDEAWRATLEMLTAVHQKLQRLVLKAQENRLDEPIVEGGSSTYVTLHGIVQHNIYHAGQIALLKKA
jgi:uncharacterized damage-inducible protein DinB